MNPQASNPHANGPRDGDYARYVEEMVESSARALHRGPDAPRSGSMAWGSGAEPSSAQALEAASDPPSPPSPAPAPDQSSRNRPPAQPPGPPPRSRAPARGVGAIGGKAAAVAPPGLARWLMIAGFVLIVGSILLGSVLPFPAGFLGFVLIAIGVAMRRQTSAARR